MLLRGLPDEARSRRENPDEPLWGTTEELLAQVVEEVSVLAAERRRKKPREIPRPGSITGGKKTSGGMNYKQMAALAMSSGGVRHG